MKKYILGSLLWVFALFGAFASAESFTFNSSQGAYENSVDYSDYFTTQWWFINFTNFDVWDNWESHWYAFEIQDSESQTLCCIEKDINVDWVSPELRACAWYSTCQWYEISAWTYKATSTDEVFDSVSFTISATPPSAWWDDWDNSWSLLPWGENDLSWIISWLSNTINEFIPYLVYLGLWIITALIWFVAIRWLINRTSSKVRWTFSSWRRRR